VCNPVRSPPLYVKRLKRYLALRAHPFAPVRCTAQTL
jgi:hypothetical protein